MPYWLSMEIQWLQEASGDRGAHVPDMSQDETTSARLVGPKTLPTPRSMHSL